MHQLRRLRIPKLTTCHQPRRSTALVSASHTGHRSPSVIIPRKTLVSSQNIASCNALMTTMKIAASVHVQLPQRLAIPQDTRRLRHRASVTRQSLVSRASVPHL